jgi:hypothetical protein
LAASSSSLSFGGGASFLEHVSITCVQIKATSVLRTCHHGQSWARHGSWSQRHARVHARAREIANDHEQRNPGLGRARGHL